MVYVLSWQLPAKVDNSISSIFSSLSVKPFHAPSNFTFDIPFPGSGIGFMVVANIVADVVFMYIHKHRAGFREGKFSVISVKKRKTDDQQTEQRENAY